MTRNLFNHRRGFTLLETLVAFAILGIGLIMIAAIFPAALLEHQRTVDRSRAMDLATKAEALLHSRINPRDLYVNNADLASGFDSPWLALPTINMPNNFTGPQNSWEFATPTSDYFAVLNNTPIGVNPVQLFGADLMTDDVLPRFNEDVDRSNNRLVWQGFYRTMASGTRHFAIAVCKQRPNHVFARQDPTAGSGGLTPFDSARIWQQGLDGSNTTDRVRFPVPWRVTVARNPQSQTLFVPTLPFNRPNAVNPMPGDVVPLASIAPRGAKLLIQGRVRALPGNGVLDFPGGRILTVKDTDGWNKVQVLEDISDIRGYDTSSDAFSFDIWVFPPPILGNDYGTFSNESPVLEWKVSL